MGINERYCVAVAVATALFPLLEDELFVIFHEEEYAVAETLELVQVELVPV